jgi:hypothetical protein
MQTLIRSILLSGALALAGASFLACDRSASAGSNGDTPGSQQGSAGSGTEPVEVQKKPSKPKKPSARDAGVPATDAAPKEKKPPGSGGGSHSGGSVPREYR